MAGGVILSSQTRTQTFLFSIPKIPLPIWNSHSFPANFPASARILPKSQSTWPSTKKLSLDEWTWLAAGLKTHQRIAIGVSGGPDSMALCALTAYWKGQGFNGKCDSEGFIDGILAIIVDHGLRAESTEEASVVSNRVAKMGITSDVACCDWSDGKPKPKQGHVQEAARDMRYAKGVIRNG